MIPSQAPGTAATAQFINQLVDALNTIGLETTPISSFSGVVSETVVGSVSVDARPADAIHLVSAYINVETPSLSVGVIARLRVGSLGGSILAQSRYGTLTPSGVVVMALPASLREKVDAGETRTYVLTVQRLYGSGTIRRSPAPAGRINVLIIPEL